MVRVIGSAVFLAALWLVMSGVYKNLTMALGAFAVVLSLYIARRMDRVDGHQVELDLNPLKTFRYFLWLMVEIAKANWAATKVILAPTMPLRQHLFRVPYTQRTELAQVMFANSITLTPGTITVEVEDREFMVHALNFSEDDIDALADMDAQVKATERVRGT